MHLGKKINVINLVLNRLFVFLYLTSIWFQPLVSFGSGMIIVSVNGLYTWVWTSGGRGVNPLRRQTLFMYSGFQAPIQKRMVAKPFTTIPCKPNLKAQPWKPYFYNVSVLTTLCIAFKILEPFCASFMNVLMVFVC